MYGPSGQADMILISAGVDKSQRFDQNILYVGSDISYVIQTIIYLNVILGTSALAIFLILVVCPMHAWIYPEHRAIELLAIQRLTPEQRALLDRLWADARTGYEGRLTESITDPGQGRHPRLTRQFLIQ